MPSLHFHIRCSKTLPASSRNNWPYSRKTENISIEERRANGKSIELAPLLQCLRDFVEINLKLLMCQSRHKTCGRWIGILITFYDDYYSKEPNSQFAWPLGDSPTVNPNYKSKSYCVSVLSELRVHRLVELLNGENSRLALHRLQNNRCWSKTQWMIEDLCDEKQFIGDFRSLSCLQLWRKCSNQRFNVFP